MEENGKKDRLTSCCVLTSLTVALLCMTLIFYFVYGFNPFAEAIDAFFKNISNAQAATSGGSSYDAEANAKIAKLAMDAVSFGQAFFHFALAIAGAIISKKKGIGEWPSYQKKWLLALFWIFIVLGIALLVYSILVLVI